MKILTVEPSGKGKLSQYAYNLSRSLAKAGHAVILVSGRGYKQKENSIPTVALFPDKRIGPATYFRFLRLIQRERPDIIHIQWVPSAPFILMMIIIKRLVSAPMIYTAHNVMPHEAKFYHHFWYSFFYRRLDRVLAHSEVDKEEIVTSFGLKPEAVNVVPVASPIGWKTSLTKKEAREELGLRPEDKLILFFGYVSAAKGIDECLAAMDIVRQELGSAKLLVVGKAFDKEISDKVNSNPGVIADLEYVSNEKAAIYFCACDIVVLPYRKANQSPIIPMAYSFGRPVIATNHQIETVISGQTGYLVNPGDCDDLARGILEAIKNDFDLKSLSDGAVALGSKKYSNEGVAKANIAVYQEVLFGA